jgi:hypothetical protein
MSQISDMIIFQSILTYEILESLRRCWYFVDSGSYLHQLEARLNASIALISLRRNLRGSPISRLRA